MCQHCKKLYPVGSRCDPCAKATARKREKTRVRLSPRERGYDAEYQRNRRWLLRSQPDCHICRVALATTADHIIPLSRGGSNAMDNLRPACGPCNYSRGNGTR
ncbi:HNH endonuclease [Streptomyces flavidovirens]|uniref:HNH endonuclease n=1 Tax=Streptomyces flavidovirens TaxID=67298 RepID=UPI003CC5637B